MTDPDENNPVGTSPTRPPDGASLPPPTLGLKRSTSRPGGRRVYWWIAAVVAAGAVVAGVLVAVSGGSSKHRPVAATSSPPPPAPGLPPSAVHDAHGLIVTLPDIKSVLGSTPLPDTPMSDTRVTDMTINRSRVTNEIGSGLTQTTTKYRSFYVSLTRWPTPDSMGASWGRSGDAASHVNSHKWIGAASRIAGLGDGALVYQFSQGPYSIDITGRSVKYDQRGANLEARYRNVQIAVWLRSADFESDGRRVKYASYQQVQQQLETVARKIIHSLGEN